MPVEAVLFADAVLVDSAPSPLDWLSAIGQLVGAIAAVAAAVIALWIAVRDGRQFRADRADRDAAQARLVGTNPYRSGEAWILRIANRSEEPVFEVSVVAITSPDGAELSWQRNLDVPQPGLPLAVLAAGESADLAVRLTRPGSDPAELSVTVGFLDAHGLRWHRRDLEPPIRQR